MFFIPDDWIPPKPSPMRPFHCLSCDVAWKEDSLKSHCWRCGRFGTRGSHPKVHFRVRRAGPSTEPSWNNAIGGVAICNWDHIPKHYEQDENGEFQVVLD